MLSRLSLAAAALAGLLMAGACAADDETVTLRVSAAASLTEVFTALTAEFEDDHPGVDVELNFGPSSVLVQQLIDGAPVDVLATADEETMKVAAGAAAVGGPEVMATNSLTLAVERGNPEGIEGVADLRRDGLVVVACAPDVPCGRLAASMFEAVGGVRADSLEEDVKAVAARVGLGEADVGVVYATDVQADPDRLEAVDPGAAAEGLEARYPVAVTTTSDREGTARDWVDFLVSEEARAVFADYGFGVP